MSMLSVVIPALNEQEAVGQVVEGVLAVQGALRREAGITELEILVVDDGSTDGTASAVSQVKPHDRRATIHLLSHEVSQGYGAALQDGFCQAQGDYLAFLDADSTYPPEKLPALCSALVHSRADLVIGDRMNGGPSHMPPLRWLGNAFFARLVSLLTGTPVADTSSGMRVFPRATLQALGPLPRGLDLTPAMTIRALYKQLAVCEVSIPYRERVGRSKLKIVRDGLRFFATICRETWHHMPVRLWRLAGLTLVSPVLGGLTALAAVQRCQPGSGQLGALLRSAARSLLSHLMGLALLVRALPDGVRLAQRAIAPPPGHVLQGEEEQAS